MEIRKYSSQDLPSIALLFRDSIMNVAAMDYSLPQAEVWAAAWEDLLCRDEWFRSMYTLVAESEGQIVGYGNISSDGYLDHLYVDSKHQRQGIAGTICRKLERHCLDAGIYRISVDASITARPFFEHRGYNVLREQHVSRRGQTLINYHMEKIFPQKGYVVMNDVSFRDALQEDVPLILDFIKALAKYEKMSSDVTATPELLEKWLFQERAAEVIFATVDGKEVGFALFFHNFSTFVGKPGLYLEDVFVLPEYRGHGYGKAILRHLASIAKERGCGRMEWSCLDWNTPSIGFYKSLGARPMDEWTVYRLTEDGIAALAE